MSRWMMRRISGLALLLLLAACQQAPPPITPTPLSPVVTQASTPTIRPLPTLTQPPAPTATLPPTETAVPSATAAPQPSATPHPMAPYTIAGMRERTYPGGEVTQLAVLEENEAYTRSFVAYPSDGLTITGMMYTPTGPGPFPVVLLLHGYVDRGDYWSGADTWQAADYLARRGYLTIAPDFRSWGQSDVGLSLFHTGLVADVLNLISSLPSLPQADGERIGLWGHSMGGGIATKVLAIDDRVDTAVLYAPNSANDADLIARWGPGCLPGQSEAAGDKCNPGESIPADTPAELIAAYLSAATDTAVLSEIAPIYHLDCIQAPVQIHIGLADGAGLTETPPEWALQLAAALEAAEKPVTLFTYPEQGHFFTGESWPLMMARTADFFAAQWRD